MSSNMNLQSPKSGVSPRKTVGDTSKQRTLKDSNWIKREIKEDDTKDPAPPAAGPAVPSAPSKPPIAAKNPALIASSRSFTDRVFSGANSGDKVFTTVKRSVDEKPVVSNEPLKRTMSSAPMSPEPSILPEPSTNHITSLTESESIYYKPPSTTVTSYRDNTAVFTSPERTLPSPVIRTETYSPSWEPSNTLDSYANVFSPTVQSSPASQKSSLPNILSYKSSESVYDTGMILRQNPTSPTLHSSPTTASLSQATMSRVVSKRDLCSICGNSIAGGDRMILDELQISSHTSCFKCELCRCSLGTLEAGDTLWVYKGMVNCQNCYKRTKDQWFR